MSFYEVSQNYEGFDIDRCFERVTEEDVARALAKETCSERDFLALLSERAGAHLEAMAARARELTVRNFGKVIHIYAPLYLANFCDNECAYCGFKRSNRIVRKKLSLAELEKEAQNIAASGIRHLLVLTGESRRETPVSYLVECVRALRQRFSHIAIEVYPLEEREYAELVRAGAEGLTLYQETYDRPRYAALHPRGPKSDYRFRLEAPERAGRTGMRTITVGALLGLADFRRDAFFTGLHAFYLQERFPASEIGLSLPRIQPQVGGFTSQRRVGDKNLVQLMLAFRLFLPRAGITLSTRESRELRKNLVGLGVTRMSAGSRTAVGGYSLPEKSEGQFDIADHSSVEEVKAMINERGYQPVMKDWQTLHYE